MSYLKLTGNFTASTSDYTIKLEGFGGADGSKVDLDVDDFIL